MLPVVLRVFGELGRTFRVRRADTMIRPADAVFVKALYWCLAQRAEVGEGIDLYSAA
jgi:hypothetical protein